MEIVRNQTPIIRLATRAGASRVYAERPTGDRHSSPNVCSRYVVTSHIGLTFVPPAERFAAGTRMRNPRPMKRRPNANFVGLDGLWRPILSQIHAKTGARRTMNAA